MTTSKYFMLIDEINKHAVFNHKFSIYTFDKSKFEQISPSEYVCKTNISPMHETKHRFNVELLQEHNHELFFIKNFNEFVQTMKHENLITTAQNI